MRRTPLILATLLGSFIVTPITFAQVNCVQLGQFTSCDGPSGGQTQVQLDRQRGVIITDTDTMPYTILTPNTPNTFDGSSFGSPTFDPTPLPSLTPLTPPPPPSSGFEGIPLFFGQ